MTSGPVTNRAYQLMTGAWVTQTLASTVDVPSAGARGMRPATARTRIPPVAVMDAPAFFTSHGSTGFSALVDFFG